MAPGLTLPILWPLDKIIRYHKIQFAKDTQLIEILLMPFMSNYSNGVTEAKLGCLGAFLERGFLFVPLPQVISYIAYSIYWNMFGRKHMQLFLSKCWETNLTKGGDQTLETPGSLPCRATSRKLWAAGLQVSGPAPETFLSYIAVLRSKSSFTGGWSDEQSVRFSKVDARCRATVLPGDSCGNFFVRYAFHSRSFAF